MTPPFSPNPSPRWTNEQIRAARQVPLVPLLQKRGLQLIETEAGNFELSAFPGLIVKESYWRWPQRDLAGASSAYDASPVLRREKGKNSPRTTAVQSATEHPSPMLSYDRSPLTDRK